MERKGRMLPYDAMDVARFVIERCSLLNRPISNLKLQKILYFLQVAFIINLQTPLFFNEIQAWDYGPVVPDVYQKYKVFGRTNIPVTEAGNYPFDVEERRLLEKFIDEISSHSTSELVDISHHQAPWIDAYRNSDETITPKSIKTFFTN